MNYPTLYDAYDNGELILESKKASEIAKYIGTASFDKIHKAAREGKLFKKRYYFKEVEMNISDIASDFTKEAFIKKFGEENYREWLCLNRRYGKYMLAVESN